MNRYTLLLALVPLLTGCEKKHSPLTSTPVLDTNPDVYILMGQSNMVGRGTMDPVTPNVEITNGLRWGPGWFFGCTTNQYTKKKIVLVQCARNGSFINDWSSSGNDYQQCLTASIPEALNVYGGKIRGMLFYQGEADAEDPIGATIQWATLFEGMVRDLRARLDLPNLPVVYAQIATTTDPPAAAPHWQRIKDQQDFVALSNCRMIKMDDLPLADHLHLSDYGYSEAGRRFYFAMQNLLNG